MNKLPAAKRAQILSMPCEGSSMRSVSRIADVSINTVSKLLVDAGRVCAKFHDENVRGVKARRVQMDEIWSFTYAKAKNVDKAKAAPEGAGDTWTWTALDADSKLIVSWLVGPRDAGSAFTFATRTWPNAWLAAYSSRQTVSSFTWTPSRTPLVRMWTTASL